MYEVRKEVHIALTTSSATLGTERLLVSEPDQKQAKIVSEHMEGWIVYASALLEVVAVSVNESVYDNKVKR